MTIVWIPLKYTGKVVWKEWKEKEAGDIPVKKTTKWLQAIKFWFGNSSKNVFIILVPGDNSLHKSSSSAFLIVTGPVVVIFNPNDRLDQLTTGWLIKYRDWSHLNENLSISSTVRVLFQTLKSVIWPKNASPDSDPPISNVEFDGKISPVETQSSSIDTVTQILIFTNPGICSSSMEKK